MADGSHNPVSNGSQSVDPRSKGWFKPGNNANPNGRPVGSRNKLDKCFVKALYADFKKHGVAAIVRTREEKPDAYLHIIIKVLPREITAEVDVKLTHEQALAELE